MYGITVRNHCASYNRSRASIVLFCPHESLVHSFSQNANCPDSPLGNKRTRFLNMSWKLPSATPESHLWQVLDGKDNINNVKLPNKIRTFLRERSWKKKMRGILCDGEVRNWTLKKSGRTCKISGKTHRWSMPRAYHLRWNSEAWSKHTYRNIYESSSNHRPSFDLRTTAERPWNDLATHTHFCVLDPSQKKKEAHPSGRASLSVFCCLSQQWGGYFPLCLSQKTPSV